jgi:AraC-like DNA-binding protein/mannose-6-phosphate isomerase-like protein (cupin superfamily)
VILDLLDCDSRNPESTTEIQTKKTHAKYPVFRIDSVTHRAKVKEKTKFWRVPQLGDLELLRASYVKQSFDRHFHEGYAVGVIESGALAFDYRGEQVVAAAGDINLATPGETHNGFAATSEGWRYRMFYLPTRLLQQAVSEVADREKVMPYFLRGVIQDPPLARQISALHVALERPETSLLEKESRLLCVMATLAMRHAEEPPLPVLIDRSRHTVARARAYLDAHFAENVSLDQISRVAGLSRFHFLRMFRREVGLPPHTYLNQVRVHRAKDLITLGFPLVEAALAVGFVDQSHLTRQFKRRLGVTPGAYSKSIQD